jgi:hypothetical protein
VIPERDRIQTVMTPAEIAEAINSGDYSAEMLMQHLIRHHNRLERELVESAQSLAFQTQLNREVIELEKKTLGERNDARAEVDQIKTILADPLAVHLNMMRGTIKWTPANLRALLGDTAWGDDDPPVGYNPSPTAAEIDAHLDECLARSERDWKPLPGDPDVFYPRP